MLLAIPLNSVYFFFYSSRLFHTKPHRNTKMNKLKMEILEFRLAKYCLVCGNVQKIAD